MGEKAPQRRQDDGRLSLLPILTERKVGPSRFPCGWRQVANRSRLDTGSVERLARHPAHDEGGNKQQRTADGTNQVDIVSGTIRKSPSHATGNPPTLRRKHYDQPTAATSQPQ